MRFSIQFYLLILLSLYFYVSCSSSSEGISETNYNSILEENRVLKLNSKTNYLITNDTVNFFKDTVSHFAYSLSYSEIHEQAKWVNYILTKEKVNTHVTKRSNNFREDPFIVTGSSQLIDYKSSGYDRGHLCPAKSMEFSEIAMSESFYMSNMSPQHPSLNRGIWKKLETLERKWVNDLDSIVIFCGGIFDSIIKHIGPNKVAVPSSFYKIVYTPDDFKAISFIFPNDKCNNSLQSYAVSIDSVEERTNLNFFSNLSLEKQNILEKSVNIFSWNL